MPHASFSHARISGISVCLGPEVRTLEDETGLYRDDPTQIPKLRKLMGLDRRNVAPPGVTSLDLGEKAARDLLELTGTAPETLDAIIFVTQTPDHPQPCNANLLHGRLRLPKSVAAFDVNQGCSGWVYGLYLAYLMAEAGGCPRVLLVAADTVTQCIHPLDRAAVPLFGDAGAATLVTRSETPAPSWFSLHSDGAGADAIKVPAGAHRLPRGPSTGVEARDEDGSIRSQNHLFMNGLEVFNFTLREEPGAVRDLLAQAGKTIEETDAFVFHQANAFIVQNLAKRLKLPLDKVPFETAGRYGNQSSASIPCALADSLGARLAHGSLGTLCSGFGVGLSWATFWQKLGPFPTCLHTYPATP